MKLWKWVLDISVKQLIKCLPIPKFQQSVLLPFMKNFSYARSYANLTSTTQQNVLLVWFVWFLSLSLSLSHTHTHTHTHTLVYFIIQKTNWSMRICFCFWMKVEERYRLICTQHNIPQLNHYQLLAACANLGACKVLIVDPAQKGTRQRIRLAIERVFWINLTQKFGNRTILMLWALCDQTGRPSICFENYRWWESSKSFG
jgi:hypothetical protein